MIRAAGAGGARRRAARRVAAFAALCVLAGSRGAADPQTPGDAARAADSRSPIDVRANVDPGVARIGDRVTYHGRVVFVYGPESVKWLPPEADSNITWGLLRARRVHGRVAERTGDAARRPPGALPEAYDTLTVEATLQAFRLGTVTIRGLRFQDQDPAHPRIGRLPDVRLYIQPVLGAADSNATLKPPRGPMEAPWWERTPWVLVLLGLAAVLLAIVIARRLLRRRPAPDAAPDEPALEPAARALADLAALRRRHLPAHGAFDEHALELTRIVRRYLEAVTPSPRPGHTTPELLQALERTRLGAGQITTLAALLGAWDRIKFARAGSSLEESMRAEEAVESLVRSVRDQAPAGRAA